MRPVSRACKSADTHAVDNVGDAADVVEVAVGDKHRADFVAPILEILGIGQNIIDARRVLLFKLEAAVDNDNVISQLHHGHVASYLLDAAERDDANIAGLKRRDGLLRRGWSLARPRCAPGALDAGAGPSAAQLCRACQCGGRPFLCRGAAAE